MGKLDKFLGLPKKIKIKEEEFSITPLTLGDMALIMKLNSTDPNIQGQGIKDIVLKALKENFPEETEEKLKQFSLENMNELVIAILEINGLKKNLPAELKVFQKE